MGMTEGEIASLFRKHGLYRTAARERIVRLLAEERRPLSAAEIRAGLAPGGADLATVYRTLNTLSQHGIVTAFPSGGGKRYLLNLEDRHEHVAFCLGCGASSPIRSCSDAQLRREAGAVGEEKGFQVISHSVIHFGYCAKCLREDKKPCKEERP